jgi:hypothetical protein
MRAAPALFGAARVLCNAHRFRQAKGTIDLYFKYGDGIDSLRESAEAVISLCRDTGAHRTRLRGLKKGLSPIAATIPAGPLTISAAL